MFRENKPPVNPDFSQIRVELSGAECGTRVWVDGTEVRNVRKVELCHEVGHPPVLRLEMYVFGTSNTVAGVAEVKLHSINIDVTNHGGGR